MIVAAPWRAGLAPRRTARSPGPVQSVGSVVSLLLQDEDEDDLKDNDRSFDLEDCHVIPNDKSTEFILATVVEGNP